MWNGEEKTKQNSYQYKLRRKCVCVFAITYRLKALPALAAPDRQRRHLRQTAQLAVGRPVHDDLVRQLRADLRQDLQLAQRARIEQHKVAMLLPLLRRTGVDGRQLADGRGSGLLAADGQAATLWRKRLRRCWWLCRQLVYGLASAHGQTSAAATVGGRLERLGASGGGGQQASAAAAHVLRFGLGDDGHFERRRR